MKSHRFASVWMALLMIGLFCFSVQGKKIEQIGLTWYTTLEEGLKVAQETNTPILLDFWDHRSAAYEQQFEHTYKDPRVKAMFRKFVLVTVHIVKEYETAKKYRVSQVPVLAFLDPKGRELARHRLARTLRPELLIERMNTVLSDLEALEDQREKLRNEPGNVQALQKIAQLYEGWLWEEEAIDCYREITESADAESETRELARLGWARCLMALGNRSGLHGDTDTAVEHLSKFIELFPKHDRVNEVRYMLAMYLIEESRNDEAAEILRDLKKKSRGEEADRAEAILNAIEKSK